MFAEIATGKTGGAELFFLLACILAGVATAVSVWAKALWGAALSLAICFGFLGFVLL